MSGKSKRKRARRAAAAAANAQAVERKRIRTETEAMQRGMGEQVASKRKARMGRSAGLMGAATVGITGTADESLG